MTVKVIAISDIHLHFWKAFGGGNGVDNKRFRSTMRVLEASLLAAQREKGIWICAGDWVHTIGWTHNPILSELVHLLQQFEDVEKYTIHGNHDCRSRGLYIDARESLPYTLAQTSRNLRILNPGEVVGSGVARGLLIAGEGYQPKTEWLTSLGSLSEEAHIGVFHQMVAGSVLPSYRKIPHSKGHTLEASELHSRFQLSIVGDVHEPQVIGNQERDRFILIPGSPEHHNFGDHGVHGYWEVEFHNDGTGEWTLGEWDLRESSSPQFITVDTTEEVQDDCNFYRVRTPGELPENAIGIVASPTVVEAREFSENASPKAVVKAWVDRMPPMEFDGEDQVPLPPDPYYNIGVQFLGDAGSLEIAPVRILKVTLDNFVCFQHSEYNVDDGITLVLGEARDYDSNGAGKTTLLEAIYWCLFGKNSKTMKADEVIRRGTSSCSVRVKMEHRGLQYFVERVRRSSGENELFVVTEEGPWPETAVGETNKRLIQWLGLTPELFQILAYFSQNRLVTFSTASDSERKEMLTDLCGLGIYEQARISARENEESNNELMSSLISRKDQHTAVLNQIEEGLVWHKDQIGAKQAEIQRLTAKIEAEKVLADQTAEDLRTKAQQDVERLEKEFTVIQVGRESTKDVRVQEATGKFETELREARDFASTKIKDTKKSSVSKADLIQQRAELEKEIRELRNDKDLMLSTATRLEEKKSALEVDPNKDPVCNVCGQPIPEERYTSIQSAFTEVLSDLDRASHSVQVCEHNLKEKVGQAELVATGIASWHQITSILQELELQESKINSAAVKVESDVTAKIAAEIAEDLRVKDLAVARINSELQQQISVLYQQAELDRGSIATLSTEVKILEDRITQLRTEENLVNFDVEEVTTQMSNTEAILRQCAYWQNGFSKKGIQSLLLEEIAAAFNSCRSEVFPLLTGGVYDVQFSTLSRTAADELREKTSFIIQEHGERVPYAGLSGGQRRRVDLGIMLTLALAVAKTRQVPGALGILVLDEVFGWLDADGSEGLYETLLEVQKTIPSIYAVTHNPNLQSLFEKVLVVKQDEDGISSLEEEQKQRTESPVPV